MTYSKFGRGRATMVALLASLLAALTLAPASHATSTTMPAWLGWHGLYANGLRASSERLSAESTYYRVFNAYRVTGRVSIWDRASDGYCGRVIITIETTDDRAEPWSRTYKDCDGTQDWFEFDTGMMLAKPLTISRTLINYATGPSSSDFDHFYSE